MAHPSLRLPPTDSARSTVSGLQNVMLTKGKRSGAAGENRTLDLRMTSQPLNVSRLRECTDPPNVGAAVPPCQERIFGLNRLPRETSGNRAPDGS